jgi:SAM-dependent methyltransferase
MYEGRFASTVPFYVRYRPRYPEALVDEVARRLRLDGTGRLLDLGCGPAFLAIAFRRHVALAVAMDPEPLMLAAAREEAAAAGVEIRIVQGSSTTLDESDGPFRLVTMGRSFHWMDRPATLRLLDRLVEPQGAVVLFRGTNPDVVENGWRDVLRDVAIRFIDDPRHPREQGRPHHDHAAVLADSPFSITERVTHRVARQVDIDAVVGHEVSKSSSSPARLGERYPAFRAALEDALEPLLRNGALDEVIDFEALICRRPAA